MKKLILFLLMSIFTLSIGYAYSPVISDLSNEIVLSPAEYIAMSDIIEIDGGINLTLESNGLISKQSSVIFSTIGSIDRYINLETIGTNNLEYTKDLYQIKAKSKRNIKRAAHIRLKRRLSDTGYIQN